MAGVEFSSGQCGRRLILVSIKNILFPPSGRDDGVKFRSSFTVCHWVWWCLSTYPWWDASRQVPAAPCFPPSRSAGASAINKNEPISSGRLGSVHPITRVVREARTAQQVCMCFPSLGQRHWSPPTPSPHLLPPLCVIILSCDWLSQLVWAVILQAYRYFPSKPQPF